MAAAPTRQFLPLLALLALPSQANASAYVGINLAGAEFGSTFPGTHGQTYVYPTTAELDYYKARGFVLVRLPFRWERLQPVFHAPLDTAELARLEFVVREIERRGMRVVLDMHNYAGYFINGVNQPLGSPQVPRSAFQDVWTRIAAALRDHDCVLGYGLMNEPVYHGSYSWKESAQIAITGIRSQDLRRRIFVCGEGWSGAYSWATINASLDSLRDPADKLVFEAHQYFDNDSSGTYDQTYDAEGATAQTGVNRLAPFVNWCKARGVEGFVGEIGVPDNDPRWITALQNAFAYLQANNISSTVWAGGPAWGRYFLNTEMRASHDEAPQMAAMLPHGGGPATRHWKPFSWYRDAIAVGAQSSYSYQYKSDTASLSLNPASAASAFNAGEPGAAGIRFAYTIPAGGWAGFGLHLNGGVNLTGNFARGHVLSFQAKGGAGSSVRVCLVTLDGVTSPRVSSPALGSAWQKVSIPLERFLVAGLDGTQRIQRVVFEGLPADGTAQMVELDSIVVEKPEELPPSVSIDTTTGVDAYRRGAAITATAVASDESGVDFVEFHLDGELLAVDSIAPYSHAFLPPGAGAYRLAAIAFDRHGNPARSTSRTLTVTEDPANYDAWRALYFTAAELASAELEATRWGVAADPDGDGLANLIEYAAATDPLGVETAFDPLELIRGDGNLVARYRRAKRLDRDAKVSLEVLTATDLGGEWFPLPGPGAPHADLGDAELRDVPLPEGEPSRFVRLRATRQP